MVDITEMGHVMMEMIIRIVKLVMSLVMYASVLQILILVVSWLK